jgi:hypothetical protein
MSACMACTCVHAEEGTLTTGGCAGSSGQGPGEGMITRLEEEQSPPRGQGLVRPNYTVVIPRNRQAFQ